MMPDPELESDAGTPGLVIFVGREHPGTAPNPCGSAAATQTAKVKVIEAAAHHRPAPGPVPRAGGIERDRCTGLRAGWAADPVRGWPAPVATGRAPTPPIGPPRRPQAASGFTTRERRTANAAVLKPAAAVRGRRYEYGTAPDAFPTESDTRQAPRPPVARTAPHRRAG